MHVEIKIDNTCKEPKLIVVTDKMTDEINALIRKISEESPQILSGFRNDTLEILEQPDILRLYASAIWDMESWSLLKMTVIHLVICSTVTFPVAYFMQWMPHNMAGFLLYFGTFLAIYLIIWISQYQAMKKRIVQINHKIQNSSDKI